MFGLCISVHVCVPSVLSVSNLSAQSCVLAHTRAYTCVHAYTHSLTQAKTHTYTQEWDMQPEELEEQRSLASGGYVGVRRVARLLEVRWIFIFNSSY